MNPFSFSGLLAGVSSLAFGLLVFLKSENKRIGRIWLLFSLSVSVWGFGGMAIGLLQNPDHALFVWRVSFSCGVIWIPILFHHFVSIFCFSERKKSNFSSYLAGVVFLIIAPTSLFFSSVRSEFREFFYAEPGLAFPFFTAWWFGSVVYSHVVLIRAMKGSSETKRNQIKYFFLATAVGYGGGGMDFLPIFGVNLYPWGNFAITLYPLIMSFAILRYRLMDIRIFMRRAGLLVLVYGVLVTFSAPALFFLHQKAMNPTGVSNVLIGLEVAVLATALSLGPFLYAYFIKQSSFFREDAMAGLTHELKSPLAIIQSAVEMLARKPASQQFDPKQQADYVEMIQRNAERLSRFIEELLVVFKPSNDRPLLSIQETNLVDIFQRVARDFGDQLAGKNLTLSFNTQKEVVVLCDPNRIEKVLSNLLSNAIKFSKDGKIELSVEENRDQVKIILQDYGEGIPAEDLSRLFERFFQGTKHGRKGTGVGLAVSKTWVEAHGGQIGVKSDGEGKGSRFWFTLPKS